MCHLFSPFLFSCVADLGVRSGRSYSHICPQTAGDETYVSSDVLQTHLNWEKGHYSKMVPTYSLLVCTLTWSIRGEGSPVLPSKEHSQVSAALASWFSARNFYCWDPFLSFCVYHSKQFHHLPSIPLRAMFPDVFKSGLAVKIVYRGRVPAQIPDVTASAGKKLIVFFSSFPRRQSWLQLVPIALFTGSLKFRAQIEATPLCLCILAMACEKKQIQGSELLAVLCLLCG